MSFDFAMARLKHGIWNETLDLFVNDEDIEKELVSADQCALGKWIAQEGLIKYGHLLSMGSLVEIHLKLHGIVKEVVTLKKTGDNAAAKAKLAMVQTISDELMEALDRVETEVKG